MVRIRKYSTFQILSLLKTTAPALLSNLLFTSIEFWIVYLHQFHNLLYLNLSLLKHSIVNFNRRFESYKMSFSEPRRMRSQNYFRRLTNWRAGNIKCSSMFENNSNFEFLNGETLCGVVEVVINKPLRIESN